MATDTSARNKRKDVYPGRWMGLRHIPGIRDSKQGVHIPSGMDCRLLSFACIPWRKKEDVQGKAKNAVRKKTLVSSVRRYEILAVAS